MFDSIAKVWNEVSEEGNGSVNFVPTERRPLQKSSQRTSHYIHYDKPQPRNPLHRIIGKPPSASRRQGSPRILKPSTEQKKNTFWGTLGKILSGGGDQKEEELGKMKDYMSGMIRKRPREMSTTTYDERSPHTSDLKNTKQSLSFNDLQQKASDINERADRFFNNDLYPDLKRIKRLQSKDLETSQTYTDSPLNMANRQYTDPQYSSTPKETRKHTAFNNRIIKINELPSSPFVPVDAPKKENVVAKPTVSAADESIEKINELSAKVEYLENTVQSLRDELRLTNERSMLLEQSFRLNSENSVNQTPAPSPRNDPDQEFEDAKPLSPVKLDLNKFKLIR